MIWMALLFVASTAQALLARGSTLEKFNRMIGACALSPATIEFIDDPKLRTIFHGIRAANDKPEVRNAFAIVYQDLGPVRVAGDLIFGRLERIADDAHDRVDGTELQQKSAEELATARQLFDAFDEDHSGELRRDELLASPALLGVLRGSDTARAALDDEELVDNFVSKADSDGDGSISFVEFVLASASTDGGGGLRLANAAANAALDEYRESKASAATAAGNAEGGSQRSQQASRASRVTSSTNGETFDEMLATCMTWEETILCRGVFSVSDLIAAGGADVDEDGSMGLDGDGCATPEAALAAVQEEGDRLVQVLLGTFAGGRTPEVAAALRVCYEEYTALRVGGDLIFRVLKTVVARMERRMDK